MKKLMLLAVVLAGLVALPGLAEAKGSRSYSGRSHSSRSYRAPSRGYYTGPRQPPGTYRGGAGGSSHKGGHYSNAHTGHRYQKSR